MLLDPSDPEAAAAAIRAIAAQQEAEEEALADDATPAPDPSGDDTERRA